MKSLKKTLVLLVVFSMILSAVMPAFAATDIYGLDCEEEVARLEALEVVSGYDDGTFGPEKTITRAEMAVILCKMVGIDEVTAEENKAVPSKFSDVKVGEWYTGFVNVAAGKGLLSGFPDGTFRPSEQLTMNQVLTLCVNALGRGEYVSEMGAWPANYIAEATKLGLLDGVKTSDANRGNVAIIVWNTLEAPYVWDVTNTEYEGTINLGNSTRSLLSIYFRDFSYDAGTYDAKDNFIYADRLLKEAEYVQVMEVPSTDGDLGEKQLVLAKTEDTDDYFTSLLSSIKANKKPRGTDDEEWTSVNTSNEIVAYAPSFEELDSYFGKIVTVIFGKDNEVISIRVIDETVEDEYLTAYEDKKLKISGKEYKFADEADVYVNTVPMTESQSAEAAMSDIETELGIDFDETYGKVIKANVVLNSKGKVTRLDLFVSGNYDLFFTKEAIVSKVRNEIITLETAEGDLELNYGEDGEYEEEDSRPRILKDNKVIAMEDIAVGDVLTYYYTVDEDTAAETIKTVYVSSNTVEGDLTRVSKSDLRMTVEGEKYFYSMGNKTLEFLFTDDKISDATFKDDASDYIGENVTLYMNVYGEYVLMASEAVEEDWVFGVVTKVPEEAEEDEEDLDIYRMSVRILLADGTTARNYKFLYDDEKDAGTITSWENGVKGLINKLVIFAPDANGEIAYGDYVAVEMDDETVADDVVATQLLDSDYYAVKAIAPVDAADDGTIDNPDDKATIDEVRERINQKLFANDTVIFNIAQNAGDDNTLDTDDDVFEPEVSTNWKLLVANKELAQDAMLIYDIDTDTTLAYVMINVPEYVTSDAEYAIVETDDYKEKRGSRTKKYTELLVADSGVTEFETLTLDDPYTLGLEDYFVEYKLSGDKISTAAEALIDLIGFKALKVNEEIGSEITETVETELMVEYKDLDYKEAEADDEGALYIIPATKTVKENDETLLASNLSETELAVGKYVKFVAAVCAECDCVAEECECDTPCGNDHDVVAAHYVASVDTNDLYIIPAKNTIKVNDTVLAATDLTNKAVGDYVVALPNKEVKANFKVVDTQKLVIEYANTDTDVVDYSFGLVNIDEDVVVYDARREKDENGDYVFNFKTMTFSQLRDEVETNDFLYVIPFANSDAEANAANILVIVD